MKNTVLVLFVLSGLGLHAQVWIDSLRSAQEQYKQNDFERALDLYKKSEVDLKDVLFLKEELAQSAYRSGDYDLAHSAFESVIEKETNPIELSRLYYNQGNVSFKKGNVNDAIENYKKSIIQDPNNLNSKYNLSQALKQKRQNQSSSSEEENNSSEDQENPSNSEGKLGKEKEFSMEKQAANRKLNELLKNAEKTKRKVSEKPQNNQSNGKDW